MSGIKGLEQLSTKTAHHGTVLVESSDPRRLYRLSDRGSDWLSNSANPAI